MCEETKLTLEAINERLSRLEDNFKKLKEWSDLNDYWFREMIDSLTETINHIEGITDEETGGLYHCEFKSGRE